MRSKQQAGNRRSSVLSRAVNLLLWIFMLLSVALVLLVASAKRNEDGLLSVFGKSLLTVSTSSMDPTFCAGDLLLIDLLEPTAASSLSAGDVITFRSPVDINGDGDPGELNTHRITVHNKAEGYFITKGDNGFTNPTEDPYRVSYEEVVGLYTGTRLSGIGKIFSFLRSSRGFFLCIMLPLMLFFLYEVYELILRIGVCKTHHEP